MSLVVLVVHNPNLIKHSITYCELKSRPHNHKMTMTEFWISARRMTKTGFLEFYHIPSSYDFYDDIRKKSHKIKWKKIVHWLKNEFLSYLWILSTFFQEKINLPLFFLLRTFQVIIQVVLGFLAQGAMLQKNLDQFFVHTFLKLPTSLWCTSFVCRGAKTN